MCPIWHGKNRPHFRRIHYRIIFRGRHLFLYDNFPYATNPRQPQKYWTLSTSWHLPGLPFWSRTCSPAKQGGTSTTPKNLQHWESPLPDWKYETQKPDIRFWRWEAKTPGVLFRYLVAVCLERSSNHAFCWGAISSLFMFCGHLPWHVFLLVKHWKRTSMIKTCAVCSAPQTEPDFCQYSAAPCGNSYHMAPLNGWPSLFLPLIWGPLLVVLSRSFLVPWQEKAAAFEIGNPEAQSLTTGCMRKGHENRGMDEPLGRTTRHKREACCSNPLWLTVAKKEFGLQNVEQ